MNGNDQEEKVTDVIIIGGGPAGLSAATYASRAGLETLVIDKNPLSGALGSTDKIENYPGVKGPIKGIELISRFKEQADDFGARHVVQKVLSLYLDKDAKVVMTDKETFKARAVIVATGSMGRKPTIDGEKEYLGKGVSYCATCDAPFYKGKNVVVTGKVKDGGEDAEILAKFAKKVYLVTQERSKDVENERFPENVEVLSSARVTEINGDQFVESVKVHSGNEEKEVQCSGIFIFLQGAKPITNFLPDSVKTTERGCIKVDEGMQTSVEGIFAAGDVTCTFVRQVVLAVSEGCRAALSADKYVRNRKKERQQWS